MFSNFEQNKERIHFDHVCRIVHDLDLDYSEQQIYSVCSMFNGSTRDQFLSLEHVKQVAYVLTNSKFHSVVSVLFYVNDLDRDGRIDLSSFVQILNQVGVCLNSKQQ